jgi:hypothetical protein
MLERFALQRGTTADKVLRDAIDAYDPDWSMDNFDDELLGFVSSRVQEAITDIRKTRKKLDKALEKLSGNSF